MSVPDRVCLQQEDQEVFNQQINVLHELISAGTAYFSITLLLQRYIRYSKTKSSNTSRLIGNLAQHMRIFAKQLLKKKLLRGNFEYCRVSVIISPKRKFTLQYFLSCPGKGGYEWLSIFDRLVFPIRLWGPFNSFVVNSVYIRTIFCRCVTRMWMSQRCTSWHDLLMLWVQTQGTKPRPIMWLLVGGVAEVQAPPWEAHQ